MQGLELGRKEEMDEEKEKRSWGGGGNRRKEGGKKDREEGRKIVLDIAEKKMGIDKDGERKGEGNCMWKVISHWLLVLLWGKSSFSLSPQSLQLSW